MTRKLPVLLAGLLPLAVAAAGFNDTGSIICTDGSTVYTNPLQGSCPTGQDSRYGVSAMDYAGVYYSKKGSSSTKGRDYSKVCNSGEIAGTGACPANPALGNTANDWGCTKDNVTGFIWEMKANDATSLHHRDWTYSWNDSNPATNGGVKGYANLGTCLNKYNASTNPTGNACDTQGFVAAVNAAGLCGASDWRLPSVKELETIVDYNLYGTAYNTAGAGAIDSVWFPNLGAAGHWTSSPSAGNSTKVWTVGFTEGNVWEGNPQDTGYVRLVRGTAAP